MAANSLDRIEHIVVLMLENRSFDNLFGWLYDPTNPAPFDRTPPDNFEGVYGRNLSNLTPTGRPLPFAKGNDPTAPFPDPGETFQDVYAQIFGQKTVLAANAVLSEPLRQCSMGGFVYNYALKNAESSPNAPAIMNGFTPSTVPVLSSLAHYYGVCDHWFASIPSETLCNRSFVQAGTSSGYVNNGGGDGLLFTNKTPTIFNLLGTARKTWKVYCGGWTITSLVLLTQEQVWPFALEPDRFEHVSDFVADTQKPGGLPAYSFIEPNYIDSIVHGPENDMHPESHSFQLFGRSNVEQGEKLVFDVYTAIRKSPDWEKILFIILFDEHGGCYDHVCPPTSRECPFAISPDGVAIPQNRPGGTGFAFDRLGVRVPAIIISAYTPEATVVNTVFDHTSVLSTVVNRFGLAQGKLGKRQAAAPDVSEALALSDPRQDWPAIATPSAEKIGVERRALALANALTHATRKPISEIQRRILIGSARRLGLSPADQQEIGKTPNAMEADAILMKFEAQLRLKQAMNKL